MSTATKSLGSASDYQLTGDDDTRTAQQHIITSFFVYTAWSWPNWLSCGEHDELRLGHGVQRLNDLEHVMIAGAVFSAAQPGLEKFRRYEWRHYLYLTGIVLLILGFIVPNHDLLPTYVDEDLFKDVGDWAIGVTLWLLFWLVAWLIHGWAVWGLESHLTRAMEDLNFPYFQLAGYRISYQIEATGPMYTLEHRIYILSRGDKSKDHITILDVLPDSTRPLFMGQKTVYLHTASVWGSNSRIDQTSQSQADKHYLHRHGQPAMLNSIHPLLWGAIHQAFWLEEIDQLKNQRRLRTTDSLLVAFLASLWLWPSLAADQAKVNGHYAFTAGTMWRSWVLAFVILGILIAFYWAFLQLLMNRAAATVGHARWTRATQLLGPVLENYYWKLEYHPPAEATDRSPVAVQDGTAEIVDSGSGMENLPGPPQYCLAFVPYVPRVPYQASSTE